MRLIIKVPASFGRFGDEVEGLGIAVSLYNDFYFEKAKAWEFLGFPKVTKVPEEWVKKAIEKTFWYAKKDTPGFKVTLTQCIPMARGLGFNATCIAAGVLAANYFLSKIYSPINLLNIAAGIYGSSEHLAPIIFGGLCSDYQFEGEVKVGKYPVHENLVFTHLMPKFPVPQPLKPNFPSAGNWRDRQAKAINLPRAFQTGDLPMLREILAAQTGETRFIEQLKSETELKQFLKDEAVPYFVNDHDFTLTFISKGTIVPKLRAHGFWNRFEVITLTPDSLGGTIEAVW
jgi:homoserine kinase